MDHQSDLESVMPSVRRYIDRVRQEMPVTEAYLFGSYARGEAREDSDIDLAIVSPALGDSRFHNNVRLGLLTWDVDTRIEPLGYNPETFGKDFIMPEEIRETGIRVWPVTTNETGQNKVESVAKA
jgi:predicted nucleotidyltransferase